MDNYPDEEIITVDGYDAAFIGVGQSYNRTVACYDFDKLIEILMKDTEYPLSYKAAVEYFDFNLVGMHIGENAPIFIRLSKMPALPGRKLLKKILNGT
jgi:hypothetical protein